MRVYTCDDGSGSIPLRVDNLPAEHQTGGTGIGDGFGFADRPSAKGCAHSPAQAYRDRCRRQHGTVERSLKLPA